MSDALDGLWNVRWVSGLLPPWGISKRISGEEGVTRILSVPLMPFRVRDGQLHYVVWPIRDTLERQPDGTWLGEGFVFGIRFCRFRLEPA